MTENGETIYHRLYTGKRAFQLSVATVLSLVTVTFPTEIFSFYSSKSTVLAVAMEYLPVAIVIFYGSALRAPMNSLINGSGNYRINFVTAILDGIVLRIRIAYYFSGKWKRTIS